MLTLETSRPVFDEIGAAGGSWAFAPAAERGRRATSFLIVNRAQGAVVVGNNPVNWIDPLGLIITYHGFSKSELAQVKKQLAAIKKTKRGKQLVESAENNKKRDFQITKDCTGKPNYDPSTDKINFDPNFDINIPTTDKSGTSPATPEGILAHELGHAVTGTLDDGPNNMNNVNQNENPVRQGLGLPTRTAY